MKSLLEDKPSSDPIEKKQVKGIFRRFFFKAYHPPTSVKTTVIVLSILGLIFIIVGSILISYSESVKEYTSKDYYKSLKDGSEFNITIEVKKKMKKPVFLYYKIDEYFQNHRIYSLSKSVKQLQGNRITSDEAELNCDRYDKYKDIDRMEFSKEKKLDKNDIAYPCGLVAKTFVNDIFELYYKEEKIEIEEDHISWDFDRNSVFKNYDINKQWIDFKNGKKLFRTFYCVDENCCFGRV